VTKAHFANKPVEGQSTEKTDIRQVSDKTFLDRATGNTLDIYQQVCSVFGVIASMLTSAIGNVERRVATWPRHRGL
jgi:hypothetical protein